MASGVGPGQFPDSTREVVLPSPLMTEKTLQFFAVAMPQFSPSFDSTNHLVPSYAAAPIRFTYGRRRKLYRSTNDSWIHTLQAGSNQILSSQPQPGGMANPLNTDSLTDPLKSQSLGLPQTDQPN